jgi:hypothetical protein
MEGTGALEVYEKAGMAGVFLVLYVTTVWFLIRMLAKDKAQIIADLQGERTRMTAMAQIVQGNTESNRQVIEVMRELKGVVEKDADAQREMIAYFKAKDSFSGGSRG